MRVNIFAAAGGAALVIAGAAGLAALTGAEAQNAAKPPVILVVDTDKVISQSKAGQTIPQQAEAVRASVAGELEAEAEKLRLDIEKYQKNASLMSDEVRQQTEQELAVRQQYALPQRAQIADQAFRLAIQNAQGKILVESQPILKDIVEKRGATVLLDRAAVMYAAVETDVTQEVIAALDKELQQVEVQKISLAEIERQLREAQQKAQQAAQGNKNN
jgi:Skp family chaperone for outer membrane proteins